MGDGEHGADVVIVDGRHSHRTALATVERLRTASASVGIFVVADEARPDAILEAMRAGANEFLTWPPAEDTLNEALRRVVARQAASPAARKQGTVFTFIGAKGGVGTTTVAVNCAVDLARLSKRSTVIVDLKQGMGEVALSLGVRGRYSVLDAIDNLHRLDSEFLQELLIKHKSGLEILAASDQFERPGSNDANAIEEVLRLLTGQYEYVIVDAGSQVNSCSLASLYMAETMFLVTNPDVPSMRNAQRVLDRVVGQIAASAERVRVVLNRASEPYPIPVAQMEAALGHPIDHTLPSDYRTVSGALNAGVPVALSGRSQVAVQFDRLAKYLLNPDASHEVRRGAFGRLASLW